MDEELRALERAVTTGGEAARRRYRRAVERAGRAGLAEGLARGDRVRVRSCLPGGERVFEGVVQGVAPDGVPIVHTESGPDSRVGTSSETVVVDVTGCPRCTVEWLDPPAAPAVIPAGTSG